MALGEELPLPQWRAAQPPLTKGRSGTGQRGPDAQFCPEAKPGLGWRHASDVIAVIIRCTVRTTLDLDPVVLERLKRVSREQGRTAGAIVSELLALALNQSQAPAAAPLSWTARDLGALFDLDDKEALRRALGDS